MARERTLIDEAWPGDVIGIIDRGNLRIGDTLSADGDLEFARHPALRAGALRAHRHRAIR